MDTILLPPDFKEFLKLLNSNNVKYIVVGGYAVNYHGYSRATADLDIWVAISRENATRITEVLHEFGFAAAEVEIFLQSNKVIRMGVPPLRLELLTSISGVDFDTCYQRRHVVEIDGVEVNLIHLDDLKENKKTSGRLKDLSDLAELP